MLGIYYNIIILLLQLFSTKMPPKKKSGGLGRKTTEQKRKKKNRENPEYAEAKRKKDRARWAEKQVDEKTQAVNELENKLKVRF